MALDLEQLLRNQNRFMIGFDVVLGTATLVAPDRTLAVLGHREPSDDAREAFRRCAPIWLTFAAAHTIAEVRSEPRDWWALAWLRGTEIATDALWSRSPSFNGRGRRGMWFAGASNATMALGYGWLASRRKKRRTTRAPLRRARPKPAFTASWRV
jgi:hypothetical protein